MITMENVEADHITKARCQYGKVNTEEAHWSICADTERKGNKINIARERPYEGDRVVEREWGKERKYEYVGREDVAHIILHTETLTQKHFYNILHTNVFTHTNALTHIISFFTNTRFYTQTLLHTDAFTRSPFYTQTLSHWRSYAPTLLRTNTFSSRHFCTQRRLNTQKHWHTCAHICYFTRRRFYTHMLWHNKACTKYWQVLQ